MNEAFISTDFRPASEKLITACQEVIDWYADQNLRLTLRQLFYQLVSQNIIRNEERSYKALGSLISKARLAGRIDWDAIEDRMRVPHLPNEFKNLRQLVDAAVNSYRLPRWDGQEEYIELWVEKDALSGVLARLARQHHITLMVNRGYSSQTAMYEAAQRFSSHADQECTLLYLGDHDPSGEDMVRDIQDRLDLMARASVKVVKVALTFEQVSQYKPPPNPAKLTDTRSPDYVAKHGNHCWEVDALRPDVLNRIVRDAIVGHVDMPLMDEIIRREKDDKTTLLTLTADIRDE